MFEHIFEQLGKQLAHLGEKRILSLSVGDFSIRIDFWAMIMSWVVILLLVALALILRRGLRQRIEEKPSRVQAMMDTLINLLQRQLTSNFASERLSRELFPFISTLFLFVLLCNWISVIPYCQSPTQDLNITLSLAVLVFVLSQVFAVRLKGGRNYLKGFLEPYAFLLPLNIVGEVAKPISHAFRLFGNIFGGTVLIAVITARLIPVIVPAGLNAFFGLFFGAIQAFVFAILAVAYINAAVES
jgi:F-type H+-transporting ATPase subunit a